MVYFLKIPRKTHNTVFLGDHKSGSGEVLRNDWSDSNVYDLQPGTKPDVKLEGNGPLCEDGPLSFKDPLQTCFHRRTKKQLALNTNLRPTFL